MIGRRIFARGTAIHIMCTIPRVTCIPSPKSQGTLLWLMELDDVSFLVVCWLKRIVTCDEDSGESAMRKASAVFAR